VNGTLFFNAYDATHGFRLWKSDGTEAGTTMVMESRPEGGGVWPQDLANVNGTLFYFAYRDTHSSELWKSDGTEAGTVLVKILVGEWQWFRRPASVNDTLFFVEDDGIHGRELWTSDGSEAGTALVKDIAPGKFGSSPRDLTNINGTLFFFALVDAYEKGLWKSDGTQAGTVLIKKIPSKGRAPSPNGLTVVNGEFFFTVNHGSQGVELWRSDGTPAGTFAVKSFHPRDLRAGFHLTNVNGTLFFTVDDGIHGVELWRSNGTPDTVTLVKDIWPGSNTSYPSELRNLKGTLFFRANDGTNGDELWRSDGTEAGTYLAADIANTGGSALKHLTIVDSRLFMVGADDLHGSELWTVADAEPGATVMQATINGPYSNNRSDLAQLALKFDRPAIITAASSLQVFNHTSNTPLDISAATLLNNGGTALTWNFSDVSFADGFNTATLPVMEGPLSVTHSTLFHVLTADGNGDARVDFDDWVQLKSSFNTLGGPSLGPGDFNGDGSVDFTDFNLLTNNLGNILAAPALDFGDAPEAGTSFPTTEVNDGARSILGSGLFLGSSVDGEADGQPDPTASGDDTRGDDEDGVVFGPLVAGDAHASVTVTATVPADTAVLNGWIDFNADGDWDDAREQVFVDQSLRSGTTQLTVTVPAGTAIGQTVARFRVTGMVGYSYFGLAPDGEVEDYLVAIVTAFHRPAQLSYPGLQPGPPVERRDSPVQTIELHTREQQPVGIRVRPAATKEIDLALMELTAHEAGTVPITQDSTCLDEDLVEQLFSSQTVLADLERSHLLPSCR